MVKKPVAAAAGSSKKKGSIGLLSFGQYSRVIHQICSQYKESATTRTKLIDSFLAFLVVLGLLQFVFCVLVGTFPFNGFLGGFASTVGQFVLVASLRIQTNAQNYSTFKNITPERAFADFLFGSLILHFIVYHFIN